MIITTTETVPGKEIAEILGIVKGNTVRARNIGRDILAGLKNLVGGEIEEYTKLIAEAREQALDRMIARRKPWERMPSLIYASAPLILWPAHRKFWPTAPQ